MIIANRLKFSSNTHLTNTLLQTGTSKLVHAQPYDRYWGTGFSMSTTCARAIAEWPGKNHLGHILEQIRRDMFNNKHTTLAYTQHSLLPFFDEYHREGMKYLPTLCTDFSNKVDTITV